MKNTDKSLGVPVSLTTVRVPNTSGAGEGAWERAQRLSPAEIRAIHAQGIRKGIAASRARRRPVSLPRFSWDAE